MSWLPSNWQDWAALITIIQFVVVVFALFYAKHQLTEATRSRELTATTQLLTEIGSPEVRKARSYVLYDLQANYEVTELKPNDIEMIRLVAVAYDRVGYMVIEKLISDKALYQFHGDDIGLVWEKVKPVAQHYREKGGLSRLHYCKRFERLATKWLPEMERKYGGNTQPSQVRSTKS